MYGVSYRAGAADGNASVIGSGSGFAPYRVRRPSLRRFVILKRSRLSRLYASHWMKLPLRHWSEALAKSAVDLAKHPQYRTTAARDLKSLSQLGDLMPKFEKHIFICGNQRPPGNPRGCCDPTGQQKNCRNCSNRNWPNADSKRRRYEPTSPVVWISASTARMSWSIPRPYGTDTSTEADVDKRSSNPTS